MISLEQVTKRYGSVGDAALHNVSLELRRSEFAYVIGDSGSGKSTLVRLLTRDERPTEGKVWLGGREIGALPADELSDIRRQVGVVHGSPILLEELSVRDNLAFALSAAGTDRRRARRQISEALELTGLTEVATRKPADLSAGQRQLATLARAAAKAPTVMLADEPTSGLDAESGERVVRVLEQLNANDVTVVVATHDRAIVDNFRKRVIELRDGRVVRDEFGGSYHDLFGSGATAVRPVHDDAPVGPASNRDEDPTEVAPRSGGRLRRLGSRGRS